MTRLAHREWSRLNTFFLELHGKQTKDHFLHACLEELPCLMSLEYVAWNEFNKEFSLESCRHSSGMAAQVRQFLPVIQMTMGTHPVVQHINAEDRPEAVGEPYMISEFLSNRELQNRAIYFEAYRHLSICDQIYIEMHLSGQCRIGLSLNASHRFSQEQKLMARLVKDHLLLAYRRLCQTDGFSRKLNSDPRVRAVTDSLSPRLKETLLALLDGIPRKGIADQMNLSLHTVNDYVRDIYQRFRVHAHAELVALFSGVGKAQ